MQRKKYENPLIVEELVFQIAPELLDRYLEGDFTCFTQGLEKWPGFMGSEVWVSSDRPVMYATLCIGRTRPLWRRWIPTGWRRRMRGLAP